MGAGVPGFADQVEALHKRSLPWCLPARKEPWLDAHMPACAALLAYAAPTMHSCA